MTATACDRPDSEPQSFARRLRVTPLGALLGTLAASLSALLMLVSACAGAAPAVSLRAHLRPLQLGRSTTIDLTFQIPAQGGGVPPLSGFQVRLPAGMGFATTTLGTSICSGASLLAAGASACPPDSVMGSGSVLVQAPFGPQLVSESAPLSIFMTTLTEGHTTMLFYVDGREPVIAPFVLSTQIRAAANSLDSELDTAVPTIPTAPGAGNVVILGFHASIGPAGVTYYRRAGGRTVSYRPEGLRLPARCPRGGLVFVASFQFQDAGDATAKSVVPCAGR
jgi:hypothetical protein